MILLHSPFLPSSSGPERQRGGSASQVPRYVLLHCATPRSLPFSIRLSLVLTPSHLSFFISYSSHFRLLVCVFGNSYLYTTFFFSDWKKNYTQYSITDEFIYVSLLVFTSFILFSSCFSRLFLFQFSILHSLFFQFILSNFSSALLFRLLAYSFRVLF